MALLHLPLVVSVYQANKFAQIVAGNIHDSCGSSLGPGCFSCVSAAAVAAGRLPLPFAGPLNISEIGNFALDDGPQIGPHNEDTRPTRQAPVPPCSACVQRVQLPTAIVRE